MTEFFGSLAVGAAVAYAAMNYLLTPQQIPIELHAWGAVLVLGSTLMALVGWWRSR